MIPGFKYLRGLGVAGVYESSTGKLLPFRRVIIDAENCGKDILSVEFIRGKMVDVDYSMIDASEFVSGFNHRMSFDSKLGFEEITSIDAR